MTDQDRYAELGQVLYEGMIDSWRLPIRLSLALKGSPQLPEEEETRLAEELLKNHLKKD